MSATSLNKQIGKGDKKAETDISQ